jgi:hypothetical protein
MQEVLIKVFRRFKFPLKFHRRVDGKILLPRIAQELTNFGFGSEEPAKHALHACFTRAHKEYNL